MNQDPLAQLRDIHLPEMPGWWPPALGWWILAILLIAGLCFSIWFLLRRHQQRAYRRQAAAELEQIWADFVLHEDVNRYIQQLSQILRRTALTAYPREQVAGLTGTEWLHFLDASSPEAIKGQFFSEHGRLLVNHYRPLDSGLDVEPLQALALTWVRQHLSRSNYQEEDSRAAV